MAGTKLEEMWLLTLTTRGHDKSWQSIPGCSSCQWPAEVLLFINACITVVAYAAELTSIITVTNICFRSTNKLLRYFEFSYGISGNSVITNITDFFAAYSSSVCCSMWNGKQSQLGCGFNILQLKLWTFGLLHSAFMLEIQYIHVTALKHPKAFF